MTANKTLKLSVGKKTKSCCSRKSIKVLEGLWKKYIFIFLVALLCFINTSFHEFTFDDVAAVVNNQDLKSFSLKKIFSDDFWGRPLYYFNSNKSYRPLVILTYWVNVLIFGVWAPGFHMGNVLLHPISSVLVAHLCWKLFNNKEIALISGLIFASHPIHCDAVASVVGRAEILGCIFFCLALLSFIKAVGRFELYCKAKTQWSLFVISVALSIGGLLSKEPAYTSCVLFGLYELACLFATSEAALKKKIGSYKGSLSVVLHIPKLTVFKSFLTRQSLNFAIFCSVMYARYLLAGRSLDQNTHFYNNYISKNESRLTRALSIPYFHTIHFFSLVYPKTLVCSGSYNSFPLVARWSDIRNLRAIALYATFFILIPLYARYQPAKHFVGIIFSLFIMLVPFSLCSNLFFWNGYEIAERIMYLPSIGFSYISAHMLVSFYGILPRNKGNAHSIAPNASNFFYKFVVATIFLLFAARTVVRNNDWKSEIDLWNSTVQTLPTNALANFNFGNELFKKAQSLDDYEGMQEALKYFKRSVEIFPLSSVYYNWGVALMHLNRSEEARVLFKEGLNHCLVIRNKRESGKSDLYRGLAVYSLNKGDFEKELFLFLSWFFFV
ncbi:protein O-mannosyl-transferase TMTC2-like [Zophobas morio]|uniref:protein O-mannosyl-transferase TMTC2-like n=1 Tax=Zophobas morio TaxID=2755281 RepID=UPI00308294A7